MSRYLLIPLFSVLALLSQGCSEDEPQQPSQRMDKRYYSGGTMTVFNATSQGYALPAPNITNLDLHLDGDAVFETNRVSGNTLFGGLGPIYNHFSCFSCHGGDGKSEPTFWTNGGSGNGSSNFLIFVRSPDGSPLPGFGKALHDQAIIGYKPDARIKVTYEIRQHTFPDGEAYELATPAYSFNNWYTGVQPDFIFSPRIPLRLVGLGLILAIPDETILELAARQAADADDEITGRPQFIWDVNNVKRVGRIDHKAENADLTVEFAFYSDIGATNYRFTEESLALQRASVPDTVIQHAFEITKAEMNAVDYYLHTLGVPARRNVTNTEVQRGEYLFGNAGCVTCHISEMKTSPKQLYTLGGTPVPEVANQTIRPYSDFLLHDMGPGLADGFPVGEASGSEWRTTPLWGIGLQKIVNGHSAFLHDGRARNLVEAIMWHGGEAETSMEYFRKLSKRDRDAVVRFLESL